MALCGYLFLEATSDPIAALLSVLAFLGVSVVSDLRHLPDARPVQLRLVFIGHFFWLYKEVTTAGVRWLRGRTSDVIAIVLLAIAAYSKPTNAPLMGPNRAADAVAAAVARVHRHGRLVCSRRRRLVAGSP